MSMMMRRTRSRAGVPAPVERTRTRAYRASDAPTLARIYFDAVRDGTTQHYDRRQREAWAPAVPEPIAWAERLEMQTVRVAERAGTVIGFMTLRDDGYIDLAFVRPDAAGGGAGSILYATIEKEARRRRLARLHAFVSHAALPFFTRHGWTVTGVEVVRRVDVTLGRSRMEERLGD